VWGGTGGGAGAPAFFWAARCGQDEQLATRHVGGRDSTRSQLIADHGIERDGRRESEREGALGQQPSASETAPQYKLSSENIALFLFASP